MFSYKVKSTGLTQNSQVDPAVLNETPYKSLRVGPDSGSNPVNSRFIARRVAWRVVRGAELRSSNRYDDELTKRRVDWKQGFDVGAQDGSLDTRGLDGFNQVPSARG